MDEHSPTCPARARKTEERQLDNGLDNKCAKCQRDREAAESPGNGQHAGDSSNVLPADLQQNLLPPQGTLGTADQPGIQQANDVETAQNLLVDAAPTSQTNMAPQESCNDPLQDQHVESLTGNSFSPLLQNSSTTSLTSVPELTEDDGESAISEPPLTPSTLGSLSEPASPVDSQSSEIVGRVEIPAIDGSMSSILENDLSSVSNLSSGLIFNPIFGTYGKRMMVDDFSGLTRKRFKRDWDKYMDMDREERPYIEFYEEGDSDLDLSDWEDKKEIRKKKRTTSPRQER